MIHIRLTEKCSLIEGGELENTSLSDMFWFEQNVHFGWRREPASFSPQREALGWAQIGAPFRKDIVKISLKRDTVAWAKTCFPF